MKKHGRTDLNQTQIVQALRDVGASVTITSMLGSGFPDIIVGFRDKTFLMEIKSEDGTLTPEQEKFIKRWQGSPVFVVRNEFHAIRIITGQND